MSGAKALLLAICLLAAAACVIAILLLFTPLRYFLPGYLKTDQKQYIIETSLKIDSLQTQADINNAYIDNIIGILSGKGDSAASVTADAELTVIPIDSISGESAAEAEFVRQYQDREKFNLSVLSPIAAEGMTFFPPVSGATLIESDEAVRTKAVLAVTRATTVSAIYRGTVIECNASPFTGMSITIQHPNGFISQYSGMSGTFVKKGEKVTAGRNIGICQGEKYPLTFELWHDGTLLDPSEYISF